MMAALFAGVSGLKNHQSKMNVIGNNIANVNTIGFKPSRISFQEALVQTFRGAGRPNSTTGGTNPIQLGLGMQVASVDTLFLQGGLETTGQTTDLAIQGSGFFILGDGNGNTFYTRAGAFGLDAASNLVDPATGLFVQGKMADSGGVISPLVTVGSIQLPFGQQEPAKATDIARMSGNIDASATTATASLVSAGDSGVLKVSGTAADGVGGTHSITITGSQALSSSYTGASVGDDGTGGIIPNLGTTMTLGTLGVTDFTNFGFSIDGGSTQQITGLNANSTVQDVINSINLISGITAKLVGGQIEVTRDRAGDTASFGLISTPGVHNSAGGLPATTGNIVGVLFGINGGSFVSAGGAASTLSATDTFLPDQGFGVAAGPFVTTLSLTANSATGLITGITGLGGGGAIIEGINGISATAGNDLIIKTEPTTYAASINVFDSLGTKHTITLEFFKSIINGRWEWTASTVGNENITGGKIGFVSFNSDGSLNSFTYFGGATGITIDPKNGAQNMQISIDAGTISGLDGLTGFSGRMNASFISQDGFGVGLLQQIAIDQSGNISGIFSNGVTRLLAQISLADFTNQAGLRKAGRSLFQVSPNSGDPIVGIAGETVSATITSGALESSAVDIAQEFTGMITAQRGFQANARIITTADSMLDELVNLRR